MTIYEALTAEQAMRTREYNLLIESAIERLQAAKKNKPSTHLGHNLGSLAHEISVAAAKVDAAEAALRAFAADVKL